MSLFLIFNFFVFYFYFLFCQCKVISHVLRGVSIKKCLPSFLATDLLIKIKVIPLFKYQVLIRRHMN